MNLEVWKPVEGNEKYEVSNLGGLRCARTQQPIPTRRDRDGYMRTTTVMRKGVSCLVHRLVANAFVGGVSNMVVNHTNGVRHDNRAVNLEVCTVLENNRHAARVLRPANQTRFGNVVLTEDHVREIRNSCGFPVVLQAFSVRFGVQYEAIYKAFTRRSWKHVA